MKTDNHKEKVTEKGNGGLRRAFLVRTLLPLVLMGVVSLILGGYVYSKSIQSEMSKGMSDLAKSVLTYYDYVYPGDYSLLVDEYSDQSYLQKGHVTISDDTSFIDELSSRTQTEISIFFYDTRMMTTIVDSSNKRMNNSVANSRIMEAVKASEEGVFFDDAKIGNKRFCAQYLPIYGQDGTLIGMIGVAESYDKIRTLVYRQEYFNIVIIVFMLIIIAIWMVRYSNSLVLALDKLRDFLGDISRGELDTELDRYVLDRNDEIADMGRYTLYVRGTLKKMIEKDPLTNLNNRRSGQTRIRNIRNKVIKYDSQYSLAMCDIDFFKKVNDTYGHDAGDAVLKEVARILGDHMAGKGTAIRWGGEEFLLVFDGLDMPAARDELWKILYEVRNTVVEYEGQQITFTMSFGVIAGDISASVDSEITAADERLYYAKEHGRNQVISDINEEEEKITMNEKQEERWDIYDANKQLTGRTMKRNDWILADGEYHLTVLGVIKTPDNRYLITKRVMTKAWAPGWWEVSGGAAMAGETSEEAVKREVLEETGLDVSAAEGGYAFTYHRENPGQGDNYFVDVYRFVMDFDESDLKLQVEETDGYMLATKEEIQAFANEDKFLHYDSIKEVFE